MSQQPYSFDEAYDASSAASGTQAQAEDELGGANTAYAEAEEAYRKALALEMWRLRRDEGVAWTMLGDLARGADDVAEFKRARDDAEGARQIASHAIFRRAADRRDVERFIDWSMRRDLAENPSPSGPMQTFGRRAA